MRKEGVACPGRLDGSGPPLLQSNRKDFPHRKNLGPWPILCKRCVSRRRVVYQPFIPLNDTTKSSIRRRRCYSRHQSAFRLIVVLYVHPVLSRPAPSPGRSNGRRLMLSALLCKATDLLESYLRRSCITSSSLFLRCPFNGEMYANQNDMMPAFQPSSNSATTSVRVLPPVYSNS
ncbi:hypothetical protein N656DRAFT_520178 [Canariomyces notabilis]|uniref:Uncharacterized protein n=1 Tax=Canariomyces notabilis TaxID=2074819 RepID=A0AAN6QBM6_9PEZI|nr:hypothetical protein N656DRAFT_520178 [Canariomyces arenarius]